MSEIREIDGVLQAISNAQQELFFLAYAVGNYAANQSPRKRHHDGVRKAAADAAAAGREVISATEAVVRLGREAEKQQTGGLNVVES